MSNNPTTAEGMPIKMRTPSQASRIFGLDTINFNGDPVGGEFVGVPRPKFLFVVRFVRGAGEGDANWRSGVSFAVKSVERPKIQPQVQTLNQYNKKRIVNTGLTYSDISIDFHDTTDSLVSSVYHEYLSYYYGDFNRETDNDWKYDTTMPTFYNTGGFGVIVPDDVNTPLEAGYFFEKLECYQFFGGHYVQFDLIHPKITMVDPDAMEYEATNTSSSIRMTMGYESIVMHNQYVPSPIMNNPKIMELYGKQLDGLVYEPEIKSHEQGMFKDINTRLKSANQLVRNVGQLIGSEKIAGMDIIPDKIMKGAGVLDSFGVFDFGAGIDQVVSPILGPIQNIIGSDFSEMGYGQGRAGSEYSKGINSAQMDVMAAQAQLKARNQSGTQSGLAAAYMASAINGKSVIGNLNSSRDQSSQIGVRTSATNSTPKW